MSDPDPREAFDQFQKAADQFGKPEVSPDAGAIIGAFGTLLALIAIELRRLNETLSGQKLATFSEHLPDKKLDSPGKSC